MSILKKVLKAAFPTMLAAIFSVSCSLINRDPIPSNPDNPDQPGSDFSETTTMRGLDYESPTDTLKMPSNALYIQKDINDYLVSYDEPSATIVFTNNEVIEKANIRIGDVLFSNSIKGIAPNGYILKVKQIIQSGETITYICEDAYLDDAFERIHTPITYDFSKIEENDIILFDPLVQKDMSDRLEAFSNMGTKSLISFEQDFSRLATIADKDRYKLEIKDGKLTIDFVVLDFDENYKTKNDQVVLHVVASYQDTSEKDFFDYGTNPYWLRLQGKPRIGGSVGLKYTCTFLDRKSKAKKQYLMNKMEQELLKKKILIASAPCPLGASVPITLNMELYAQFSINAKGSIEVSVGFENAGFDFQISSKDGEKSYLNKSNEGRTFTELAVEADLKGKVAFGAGFVFGLPKISRLFFDSMTRPYVGWFNEISANLDTKFSLARKDDDVVGLVKGDVFFEAKSFIEGYARFRDGFLWNPTLEPEWSNNRWPNPPLKYDTTFVIHPDRPVPYLIYPDNTSVTTEMEVPLKWALAKHTRDAQEHFQDITYDVYVSSDYALVDQSSPRCLLVGKLPAEGKEMSYMFYPNMSGKYYWKVVSHNSLGDDYDSDIYAFDTATAGTLKFNGPLTQFLKMNRNAIEGVDISPEGTIELTLSNQMALRAVKKLIITDPNREFKIGTINDLLVHLPALESLECMHNSLTSLDIKSNPNLKVLDCSDNNIADIQFPANCVLSTFACNANNLTSLDIFVQLPELTSLSCRDNISLTTISKSSIEPMPKSKITSLTCSNCKIKELELSLMPELVSLFLDDNSISYLDIAPCTSLVHLDVHGQSVEQMTLRLTKKQKNTLSNPRYHFNTLFQYADDESDLDDVPGEIL